MRRKIISSRALQDLKDIWLYNFKAYSRKRADDYVAFLHAALDKITADPAAGKPYLVLPDVYYIVIRRRRRGHGHIAFFQYDSMSLTVTRILHTSRDWTNPVLLAH
jgi:plasmid stabilization system protein ParE